MSRTSTTIAPTIVSLLAACATPPAVPHYAVPSNIADAVADSTRPAEDRERDADRLPAEVLAFAGLRPGAQVA